MLRRDLYFGVVITPQKTEITTANCRTQLCCMKLECCTDCYDKQHRSMQKRGTFWMLNQGIITAISATVPSAGNPDGEGSNCNASPQNRSSHNCCHFPWSQVLALALNHNRLRLYCASQPSCIGSADRYVIGLPILRTCTKPSF